MRTLALAGIAALIALSPTAVTAQAGRPDFSGFWNLSRAPARDPVLSEKIAPGTVVVEDTGAVEFPIGEYGGLIPTPQALARAQAWTPADDMDLATVCQPPSIVYAMQGPFPMEIYQGSDLMVMKLEYYDMVRVIFMDGRAHPGPEVPHTKTGHSVGYWEGDTLVVDTTHLAAATLTNNGLFHTDQMHVIERFRLSEDGTRLNATMEFEDPGAIENRGVRYITWAGQEGGFIYPYECDPTFVLNYGDPPQE
jgi:hypothetical protein